MGRDTRYSGTGSPAGSVAGESPPGVPPGAAGGPDRGWGAGRCPHMSGGRTSDSAPVCSNSQDPNEKVNIVLINFKRRTGQPYPLEIGVY